MKIGRIGRSKTHDERVYVRHGTVEDMRVPVIGKGKADDVQDEGEGRGNGGWQ